MHREASSSVHISADHRDPHPRKPPLRRLSSFDPVVLPLIAALSFVLGACSGSSPRFRTADAEEAGYAEKIRREEAREDDHKVDISAFRKSAGKNGEEDAPPGMNRDAVLLDVVSYLGVPYRYGGGSKTGIDCSGFTSNVYKSSLGVQLPRTAKGQYQTGSSVGGNRLRFGDLVFFNTTGEGVSHVGIYLENNLFAHASVTYGVTISSLESSYYRKRFVGAKRVTSQR